jgi:hypothetical protein
MTPTSSKGKNLSHHLEKILKKNRVSMRDLKCALNDMDDSLITPDLAKQLKNYLPDEDQTKELKLWKRQRRLSPVEEQLWRLTLVRAEY